MLKKEWKSLLKSPIMMIVLIAIILIPSIYTCLFLASMWDPYGELDKLPVAVVNNDKPVEYNEKTLQVGQDLVDNLKDNDELDFHFVDPIEAQEGIENGTYYMVITIPENFSENASTVMDDTPTQMVLNYETNPGTNYIASKLSSTAMTKIKDTLSEEIVRTYTEEVFDSISEAGDGMQDAADGAGKIEDGTDKLIDGNDTISENLQVLADSTVTFKNGSKTLTTGLKTYTDGVAQVDAGAKQLKDGTSQLASGAKQLDDGAAQVAEGTDTLNTQVNTTLKAGTSQLEAGVNTLAQGVTALNAGVNGENGLAQGITALNAGVNGENGLAQGIAALNIGVNVGNAATGTPSLASAATQLDLGINQVLMPQMLQLQQGAALLYQSVIGDNTTENPGMAYVTGTLAKGLQQLSEATAGATVTALSEDISAAAKAQKSASDTIDGISEISSYASTAKDASSHANDAKKAITAAQETLNSTVAANNTKAEEATASINTTVDKNNDITASNMEKAKAANSAISSAKEKTDDATASAVTKTKAELQKAVDALEKAQSESGVDLSDQIKAVKAQMDISAAKADVSDISFSTEYQNLEKTSVTFDKADISTDTLDSAADSLEKDASKLKKADSINLNSLKASAKTLSSVNDDLQTYANLHDTVAQLSALATGLDYNVTKEKGLVYGVNALYTSLTDKTTLTQLQTLAAGAKTLDTAVNDSKNGLAAGVTALHTAVNTSDNSLASGVATLNAAVNDSKSGLAVGVQTLYTGVTDSKAGLATGVSTLAKGVDVLAAGTQTLADGTKTLKAGTASAVSGSAQLDEGASTLTAGTGKLVANNDTLNDGASQLTEGAGKIQDGSQKLADGSVELGDGLSELKDGANELTTALQDGADEVKDNTASDATLDMFSAPVDAEETQVTTVDNNGSAMSAYMMCVGLWVGALAFCLLYPLTKYRGKLKGGFSWWISKASIAYPAAVLMGLIVVGVAHATLGFTPGDLGKELTVACLACVAFMSMQYFANVALGKVGSFLMLVFMVLQLAGSAGTYPIQISGNLANALHAYVPFTYVVNGFRVGICGAGSITQTVQVLTGIIIVFTILTILLFQYRTLMIRREKRCFYDFLEDHGLA